jgi:hypothetical protein
MTSYAYTDVSAKWYAKIHVTQRLSVTEWNAYRVAPGQRSDIQESERLLALEDLHRGDLAWVIVVSGDYEWKHGKDYPGLSCRRCRRPLWYSEVTWNGDVVRSDLDWSLGCVG